MADETRGKYDARPSDALNEEQLEGEEQLEELYEQSFAEHQPGEIVQGTIVRVTPEDVIIDIGAKSEGVIPFREFEGNGVDEGVSVGQEVEVCVVRPEDAEGAPILSRTRAIEVRAREAVDRAKDTGEGVVCHVEAVTKGGLRVTVGGLRGFIPHSQSGIRRGDDAGLDNLVGTNIRAIILENRGKNDLILSRRAYLEEERERAKSVVLSRLRPGERVRGTVKNITDFGAFVDLGGVDGLVHVTDLSWKKVPHPSQVVKEGDALELLVLSIDGEKVSLGLKQTQEDPWADIEARYPVDKLVRGKVVGIAKYGAFVELEPGVEGLVHISELSWTRRVKKTTEVLKKGEEVEVKVLGIDNERRRISLGYRQTFPDPWSEAAEKHPKGSMIEGEVTGMTDFGAFVRLPEGVDGMIHVSDISWTKKIASPSEVFTKGQRVQAVVLEIDPEKQRISLGMKQTEQDPWKAAASRYRVGSNVEVKVVKMTEFGVFVELPEGLEGLVHISELARNKVSHPKEVVKEGDTVMMKIIKFEPRKRKLSLSLKQYEREQERREVEKYMSDADSPIATLGDVFSQELRDRYARMTSGESREAEEAEPAAEEGSGEVSAEAPAAEPPRTEDDGQQAPADAEAPQDMASGNGEPHERPESGSGEAPQAPAEERGEPGEERQE